MRRSSVLGRAEGGADRSATVASSTHDPVLSTQYSTFHLELGTGFRVLGTLLQRINREPAQQLGVEIGGLLGQHLAGKGDIANLFHAYRIYQERYLGLSVAHLQQRFRGFATIRNVLLIADGFPGNLQSAFQQALVQLNDVERLLAQRKLSEQVGADRLRGVEQKCTVGGDGEQRRSCMSGLLQDGSG